MGESFKGKEKDWYELEKANEFGSAKGGERRSEAKLRQTEERTGGQTDGRTDGQTELESLFLLSNVCVAAAS